MPRRTKQDEHLLRLALTADWKFSAALAAAALIVATVVLPIIARGSVLLTALLPPGRMFFVVFAAIFGVIAIIRYVAQRSTAATNPLRVVRPSRRPITRRGPVHSAPVDDANRTTAEPNHASPKPTRWSIELLQSLDWKRFETVVAAYFREKNFRSETLACGPDGGVDVRLYFGESKAPVGLVQCKAWGKRQVGVAPVRELLGVMSHEKIARGYFAATGDFTEDAIAFAKTNPIMLISGNELLVAIARMDGERSARLLAKTTDGDYTTPSCPSCGEKLYCKTFTTGNSAWVCKGFPRCRTRIWKKTIGDIA